MTGQFAAYVSAIERYLTRFEASLVQAISRKSLAQFGQAVELFRKSFEAIKEGLSVLESMDRESVKAELLKNKDISINTLRVAVLAGSDIFKIYMNIIQLHAKAMTLESQMVLARATSVSTKTNVDMVRYALGYLRAVEMAVIFSSYWAVLGHYSMDITGLICEKPAVVHISFLLQDFCKTNSELTAVLERCTAISVKRRLLWDDCHAWSSSPDIESTRSLVSVSASLVSIYHESARVYRKQEAQWRSNIED